MLEALYVMKDNIYFTWFALLIFFGGFCLSYIVDMFRIQLLLWFPKWFIKYLSRFINPRSSFREVFFVIFLFNSISIALYMLSGIFVIFPFIIAFLTGMNIGLTVFIPPDATIEGYHVGRIHKASGIIRLILFSTLVMIFEVITFSVALGMGMSLGVAIGASSGNVSISPFLFLGELVTLRLKAYLYFCVPVLALSAYLEARVIKGV